MPGGERILVSCEHGGHRVPRPYTALFEGRETILAGHRGWDAGALLLARWLARRLQSPLYATTATRLLVDTNRSLHNRHLFSEVTSRLGRAEQRELVEHYYLPHRRAIERRISGWIRADVRVLHLAVHSFDPRLDRDREDCDLGLLYDPRRRRERELCRRWQAALRDRSDLRVRRNHPYRGRADGLTTHLRKKLPAIRYVGIELEVNQARLSSPGGARRLRRALASTLGVLPSPSAAGVGITRADRRDGSSR